MSTTCECPSCGRRLLVPETLRESQVSCPTCHEVFVAADRLPLPETAPVPSEPPAAQPEAVSAEGPSPEPHRREGGRPAGPTDVTPGAPAWPTGDYEPLREAGPLPGGARALVAGTLLGACAVFHALALVVDFARPLPRVGPLLALSRQLPLAELALLVGTGIAFCVWFYGAHENLKLLGARGLQYTSGWAAGSFFVPIVSLYQPYQIAQETWKASDPAVGPDSRFAWRKGPGSPVIGAWWAFWLVSRLVTILNSHGARGPGLENNLGLLLHHLTAVVAALLAVVVIKQIRDRQLRKHDRPPSADGGGAAPGWGINGEMPEDQERSTRFAHHPGPHAAGPGSRSSEPDERLQ